MERAYRMIQKAVRGDLSVAVQGESGTGKELVAKAIHHNSSRSGGPFVAVNCAAIPRDLMESEVFGHERGAFTGAHTRKIGKFEQADGGTIFLDEVSEMDLGLQAKLLRALQNYEIQRVGGSDTIRFDARVISATNQNITVLIHEGRFREDLYYRLFQFPINLPPLRDRAQDTLLLADHFLTSYLRAHPEFGGTRLSAETRRAVLGYAWPGKVRELKSAVERSVLVADGDEIQPADLMLDAGANISPWSRRGAPERQTSGAESQHEDHTHGIHAASAGGGAVQAVGRERLPTLEEVKRRAVEKAYRRWTSVTWTRRRSNSRLVARPCIGS